MVGDSYGFGFDLFYLQPTLNVVTEGVSRPAPGPGLCCDLSTPGEVQTFRVDMFGVGLDVFRWRQMLPSTGLGHDRRAYAYLGGGPVLFVVHGQQDSTVVGTLKGEREGNLGAKFSLGLTIPLDGHVSLLLEYRYLFWGANASFASQDGRTRDVLVSDVHIQGLLFGLNVSFDGL